MLVLRRSWRITGMEPPLPVGNPGRMFVLLTLSSPVSLSILCNHSSLAAAINWLELLIRSLAVIRDNLGLIFFCMLGKAHKDTHIHEICCTWFYVDCTDSRMSILKWTQTKNLWRKQVFSASRKLAFNSFSISMDFWPSPHWICHFLGLQT